MTYIPYIQIALSVVIAVLILLQQRGAGMSGLLGGDAGGVYQTRRGLERIFLWATVISIILFIGLAIMQLTLG